MVIGEVLGKRDELMGIIFGGLYNFWVLVYDVYFLRIGFKFFLVEVCYFEKYFFR